MYALSKAHVSLETARALIRRHFGASRSIRDYAELTDGMYNAAYQIKLDNGLHMVLKVAPADHVSVLRYEKNIMQAEVEVLRLLRAQTEVPVPEVFAYDTSRQLLDHDYYLMSFVPGVSMHRLRSQLAAEDQQALDYRTGEYLRQINAIAGDAFGYFAQPETRSSSWRQAFDRMLRDVLQDGRDAAVLLPIPYDELYARLQLFYPALDEVVAPCLVYWDLWDGNIFVDPARKQITGIIDCERARWADPLMEVNFGAFGINPHLIAGYGRDLLAGYAQQQRRALYNVYLWLIMIIECTYRQFETKDQETWARNQLVAELEKF